MSTAEISPPHPTLGKENIGKQHIVVKWRSDLKKNRGSHPIHD
jgi:hypothetical protein